jgi:8-oxo-dGTP diphosphatase
METSMPASNQKISSDRYTIIPRTLIFLTCRDTILLLRGSPQKRLWAGLYNGIGGHIERDEDVLSAARRELHEETGMKVSDIWLCGTVIIDAGKDIGIGIFVFRGEYEIQGEVDGNSYASGTTYDSPDGTLEWVHITKIDDLPLVEDLPTLLPRVLHIHPGDPPFSALYSYNDEDQLEITFG